MLSKACLLSKNRFFSRSFSGRVPSAHLPEKRSIQETISMIKEDNSKAWPIETVKIDWKPTKETLKELPINENAAFVRIPDELLFINKKWNDISCVTNKEKELCEFDQILKSTNENRVISADELDKVLSIADVTDKWYLPVGYVSDLAWEKFTEEWNSGKYSNNSGSYY